MESGLSFFRRMIRLLGMPEASFRVQFTLRARQVELAVAYTSDRVGVLVLDHSNHDLALLPRAVLSANEALHTEMAAKDSVGESPSPLRVVSEGDWQIAVIRPTAGQAIEALLWLARELGVDVEASVLDRAYHSDEELSFVESAEAQSLSLLDRLRGSVRDWDDPAGAERIEPEADERFEACEHSDGQTDVGGVTSARSEGIGRLLRSLNPGQRDAVASPLDKHLLICAGPGTGKTEVMAARVLYLLANYELPADSVAVLTFSKEAAQALTNRIAQLNDSYGLGLPVLPKASTLHAFGLSLVARLCRMGDYWLRPNFKTVESVRVKRDDGCVLTVGSVWAKCADELFCDLTDSFSELERLEYYSAAVDCIRSGHPELGVVCRPEDLPSDGTAKVISGLGIPVDLRLVDVRTVFRRYCKALQTSQQIDFPAMVSEALYGIRTNKEFIHHISRQLRVIVIDEFQDTSRAQERLVRAIANVESESGRGTFLNVVGDDDQTIFTFNGSDVTNILDFEERNRLLPEPATTTVTLDLNYRSIPRILDVSSRLVSRNKHRIPKTLQPHRRPLDSSLDAASLMHCDSIESAAKAIAVKIEDMRESLGLAYAECAVIYRKNSQAFPQADIILRVLGASGIPVNYSIDVARKWTPTLDALYSFCRVNRFRDLPSLVRAVEEAIDASFGDRAEQEKWRGIRSLLQGYEREGLTTVQEVLASLEAIKSSDPPKSTEDGVRIRSIHKAKGQEFRCVFVVFLAEKQFPDLRAEGSALEEERRVLYVALTRGRDYVCVCGTPSPGEPDFYKELVDLGVRVEESEVYLRRTSQPGETDQPAAIYLHDDLSADDSSERLLKWHFDSDGQGCESEVAADDGQSGGVTDSLVRDAVAGTRSSSTEGPWAEEDVREMQSSGRHLLDRLRQKREQIRKASNR
jgi:DNA helicase-2/ATP-dependent DNA helicase PcrA